MFGSGNLACNLVVFVDVCDGVDCELGLKFEYGA